MVSEQVAVDDPLQPSFQTWFDTFDRVHEIDCPS
jgi:hypothetical protein